MAPYPIRANFKIELRSLSASQNQSFNKSAKLMKDSSPAWSEAGTRGSRLAWFLDNSINDQKTSNQIFIDIHGPNQLLLLNSFMLSMRIQNRSRPDQQGRAPFG